MVGEEKSWTHNCSVNGLTETFFSEECDWCGARAEQNKTTRQQLGDLVLESLFIEIPSESANDRKYPTVSPMRKAV
jgi:hypothetical protein